MNELDLFTSALALSDAAERGPYLDRACAGNPDLRRRLDELLSAHARSNNPLDSESVGATGAPLPAGATATFGTDAPAPTADFPGRNERADSVIGGKYTLVEAIGEGGMGAVWRAKQTEPVKRFVAVKLIKAGMDSKQVLARFEAERQALAMMDHPNIARVLDGGLHDGRPFFVMELVKGVPMTEYCDTCKLTPRERLELFVPVCQAIQHAHQKGVIHRDIKPSNVMVALYDDKPVVKVIDFGVAKATGAALTERTIDTGFGGVVGTPQYMSPEQATFNNLDIDTRSDVYSLGVLLYELLAGSPPFSKKELEKKGLLEILRIVREEEPPRPSTKLSTADALPSLSANRGTEPKRLTGLLRNELDWIVMKALEKDRTRRYETANAFAADVQRYLSGEAVHAHPPTFGYRLRKFYRRNRPQVIAAGVVLFALVGAVVGTTVGMVKARDAEKDTVIAWSEESKQRGLADNRLAQVTREMERADDENAITQEVMSFLQSDLLLQADSRHQSRRGFTPNPDVKARTLLDRAGERVEGRFAGRPLQEASIRGVLGRAYHGLGRNEDAVRHLEQAVKLFDRHRGPNHQATLAARHNLGVALIGAGRTRDAVAVLERVRDDSGRVLGLMHRDTLDALWRLAEAHTKGGRPRAAIELLEPRYREQQAALGPGHRDLEFSMIGLAEAYLADTRAGDAVALYEQLRKRDIDGGRGDDMESLLSLFSLAAAYHAAGRVGDAVALFEKTLPRVRAGLGEDHPNVFTGLNNLALAYRDAKRGDEAVALLERVRDYRVRVFGPEHRETLLVLHNLSGAYHATGRVEDAIRVLTPVYQLRKKSSEPDHPDYLQTLNDLSAMHADRGHLADALRLQEELVPLLRRAYGYHDERTVIGTENLIDSLERARRFGRAAEQRAAVLAAWRPRWAADPPKLAAELSELGTCLLLAKDHAGAEPVFRECLALREASAPRAWFTPYTRALLGVSLLRQKKFDEAESMLAGGYTGLKERAAAIPEEWASRLPAVAEWLIDLYTEVNKPTEVAKWRAERAKYPYVAPPPRAKK